MTIVDIVASANEGIVGYNANYNTARSTAYNFLSFHNPVGQQLDTNYAVQRTFLKFDTSVIPALAVISKANLRMVCKTDDSATDFDVQIIEQDWSASDPLTVGNRDAVYDACLAASTSFLWRNTNGMSINTQYTGADMTNAYINKLGSTYYSMRSDRDKSNTAPTGNEMIALYLNTDATVEYRPALIVEYIAPTSGFFFGLKNRR